MSEKIDEQHKTVEQISDESKSIICNMNENMMSAEKDSKI